MKNGLFVVFIGVILSSCYDCGPQKELTLDLYISGKDSLKLNRVYAKKDTGMVDLTNYGGGFERGYMCCGLGLTLPISLIDDQTTYFFEFENRRDSLTVFYKRDFRYDGNCGFVTDLYTTNPAPKAVGTFSRAETRTTSYVGGKQSSSFPLGGGEHRGGIYISVNL